MWSHIELKVLLFHLILCLSLITQYPLRLVLAALESLCDVYVVVTHLFFYMCCTDPENVMIKCSVPGAGTYAPVLEMNKTGKYVLSNVP